ncbi:DUF1826 domain-containing protein [Agarilytica rhodophyticola]|uniref:DUF1826 domain-containing protein n=1 Tax=Agarilytica rhodophyticola TaxID=1737490 RepID=UPI000B341976|nr:DUF1826 domain-containing protein [Agarilytica rhodophyticola]
MNAVTSEITEQPIKLRRAAQDNEAAIFTDIYREDTNIAIWQRQLSASLQEAVQRFLASKTSFQTSLTVSPQSAFDNIKGELGDDQIELSENIAELVDMFCCLFELKRAGLRLAILDHAMCPRFHVDRVPCRLITTYHGIATEWLTDHIVDRSKLGAGNNGLSDEQSGLFKNSSELSTKSSGLSTKSSGLSTKSSRLFKNKQNIQQLKSGDVALLKGENWEGNENAGLVHRSPALSANERRLLLTLDFNN